MGLLRNALSTADEKQDYEAEIYACRALAIAKSEPRRIGNGE